VRDERSKRLTILHVATINKPITTRLGYGPIETVIYNIDKGLHALGHRSIVACSADSLVVGERYPTVPQSLGDYLRECTPEAGALVDRHLARALGRAREGDVDVVHMHEWYERVYAGSFSPGVPIVMTLHVPAGNSGLSEFREAHPAAVSHQGMHFVAISEYQRKQHAGVVPVIATVPHGVDVGDYAFGDAQDTEGYLLSIGRLSSVKGQDTAIAVAKQSGARLIVAGCVQDKPEDQAFFSRLKGSFDLVAEVSDAPVNEDYFESVMKPILSSDKQIIYIGELDTAAKKHWFRHARAMLFPVRWGEPFGMVLIESMASGTPIVALRRGAVPEIVRDGQTGYVVDSVQAMVEAVGHIEQIDRRSCRRHVTEHFSLERMAAGYQAVYERLTDVPRLRPTVARRATTAAVSPAISRVALG
jgi:glycosyltransferase involved in cell wall biosynthesis